MAGKRRPPPIASAPTALDDAIRDRPDDVAAHLAYADILKGLGDPHGELIRLHHALAQAPPPAKLRLLRKQEAAWLARHGPPSADCELAWQLGFVRALTIRPSPRTTASHLAKVLAAPALRFLQAVRVEPAASGDAAALSGGGSRGDAAVARMIDAFVAAAPMSVRELELRGAGALDAPALGALLHDAVLPALRTLRIGAREVQGTLAIRIPALETLELRVDDDVLRFTCDAPRLHALTVVAPRLAADTLGAILHRVWPLRRLGLFAREPAVSVDELVRARVYADLQAIGLSTPIDPAQLGAREVIAHP